ncbi:MAG: cob(I)yrinic acid a,c-diamide adenosyltransferase [Gammaproteobacteria bacterium]|nr:cob(I)yrinic acid a,c-diamide adenosyltransferase [Gammaproteobacteria bacterium]
MGHRLSKIYTRTGDDGSTGLGNGDRVRKDDLRVEAFGTIDELNSAIGVVISHEVPDDIGDTLTSIQHDLFNLGGELCIPGHTMMSLETTRELERQIDAFNADLPALKEFILPGGGKAASACHLARAICRRAERRVLTLATEESVNQDSINFLNRLSDLLFVIARCLARHENGSEVLWSRD